MARAHTTPKKLELERLHENPKNPRKCDAKNLRMLAKAMREFGDLGGVVYNRRTSQLVGGHQRTRIFREESSRCTIDITQVYDAPTPQGTVAEGTISYHNTKFAYREVDWPEQTEQAANIAANRGAGMFDLPKLKDALVELDEINFDLDLTMFGRDELDDLFAGVKLDEDEAEAAQDTTLKVTVTCADSEQQQRVVDWCEAEGLQCKPTGG